jgi:hypothetical protein
VLYVCGFHIICVFYDICVLCVICMCNMCALEAVAGGVL